MTAHCAAATRLLSVSQARHAQADLRRAWPGTTGNAKIAGDNSTAEMGSAGFSCYSAYLSLFVFTCSAMASPACSPAKAKACETERYTRALCFPPPVMSYSLPRGIAQVLILPSMALRAYDRSGQCRHQTILCRAGDYSWRFFILFSLAGAGGVSVTRRGRRRKKLNATCERESLSMCEGCLPQVCYAHEQLERQLDAWMRSCIRSNRKIIRACAKQQCSPLWSSMLQRTGV